MGGKPDQPFQLSFDAAMGFRIHVIPLGHPLQLAGRAVPFFTTIH